MIDKLLVTKVKNRYAILIQEVINIPGKRTTTNVHTIFLKNVEIISLIEDEFDAGNARLRIRLNNHIYETLYHKIGAIERASKKIHNIIETVGQS